MTDGMNDPLRRRGGFTLIEVIAALVIFAGGVLMIARLSGSLSVQLRDAGLRSEVALETQFRLDSLGMVSYESLSVGSSVDTLTIQGLIYLSTVTVSQATPRILAVEVVTSPQAGIGVTFAATTYVYESW